MRREDFINEIGKIDDSIIEEVSKTRKTGRASRNNKKLFMRITAFAACVCLIISGLYFTPVREMLRKTADPVPGTSQSENNEVIKKPTSSPFLSFAIEEAVYPVTPQYPVNISDSNYEEFQEQYKAWFQYKYKRPQGTDVKEYKKSLDAFLNVSIKKLIGDNEKGENVVCSPLNLYMILSVLAEATEGQSRSQILSLLFVDNIEELRSTVSSFWNSSYCDDSVAKTILANSLWLNDVTEYNEETVKLIAEKYFASTFRGEMGSEEYNKAFASWVSDQTDGLLDEYIGDAELTDDVILAIASTLCFEAKWDTKFDKNNNTEGVFHSLKGDITAEFMNEETEGEYYYSDNFSAVNKRFSQNDSLMWFIRPDDNVKAESLFEDKNLIDLISGEKLPDSEFLRINFSAPKFDVSSEKDLNETLMDLGVKDIFNSEKSDFSPITSSPGVFVSKFTQASRITVDEVGCKAASFSEMIADGAAMPPDEEVDFVLDKPFIVLISTPSGLPLFVGVVNNI